MVEKKEHESSKKERFTREDKRGADSYSKERYAGKESKGADSKPHSRKSLWERYTDSIDKARKDGQEFQQKERYVCNRSSQQLQNLRSATRSKKRLVRESRQLYKADKERVKKLHKTVKELKKDVRREQKIHSQESDVHSASEKIKAARAKRGIAKEVKLDERLEYAKGKLESAQLKKRASEKTYKQLTKENGGTTGQKIRRAGKEGIQKLATQQAHATARQDDTLSDIARAKSQYQNVQMNAHKAKRLAKGAGKLGKEGVKKGYGLGNRFYNLHQGRGFTRTPRAFSWEGRLTKKWNALKTRFGQSKLGKVTKGTGKTLRFVSSPFRAILRNPFSIKAYVILFLTLLFMAVIAGGGSTVTRQDEFDMSETWLHFTKLDRDNSNDEVDYYTKIDEPLLFLNYRFDELRERLRINNDPRYFTDIPRGKQFVGKFWKDLNGNKDNLKTVEGLYKSTEPYKLSDEEEEEYKELREIAKETGKYAYSRELSHPFEEEKENDSVSPIYITKRYGYENKKDIFRGSILQATEGQDLYAVMDGTITVKDNQVVIADEDGKFTYEKVENIRYQTGDKVKTGEIIGQVGASSGQTVYYQKLEANREEKKGTDGKVVREWKYVNPGFFFPFVEYTQSTSVVSKLDLSGDKIQRAREFANFIRKLVPDATDEGIAAILGGFDIESSITFKRYETDYLTNNQFDLVAKEPTAENLVGSWDAFRAFYPNLRLNKGGYYVNGLHYIGIGIGQWTGPRGLALWNFAKELGKDIWASETQVRFLFERDTPSRIDALKRIATSKASVENLTEDFLVSWLGVPGNKLLERQNAAKQWLGILKNQGSGSTGIASEQVPIEYKDILPHGLPTDQTMLAGQGYPGNAYALGNCTWYVYNRFAQIGVSLYPYLGDAANWVNSGRAQGYEISDTPKVGSAVVYQPGVAGSHAIYGHVSFCEYVNSDGSFLVSEMNMNGLYSMSWRVLQPQAGIQFVIPK